MAINLSIQFTGHAVKRYHERINRTMANAHYYLVDNPIVVFVVDTKRSVVVTVLTEAAIPVKPVPAVPVPFDEQLKILNDEIKAAYLESSVVQSTKGQYKKGSPERLLVTANISALNLKIQSLKKDRRILENAHKLKYRPFGKTG